MATRLRFKVVRHPGMVVVVVALQDAAIEGLLVDVVECLLKSVGNSCVTGSALNIDKRNRNNVSVACC